MVRSCVGGLSDGGGIDTTRIQRGTPICVFQSATYLRNIETSTYIAYITNPRRENVPALRTTKRAVCALINHPRLLVLGVPKPMTLKQATPYMKGYIFQCVLRPRKIAARSQRSCKEK